MGAQVMSDSFAGVATFFLFLSLSSLVKFDYYILNRPLFMFRLRLLFLLHVFPSLSALLLLLFIGDVIALGLNQKEGKK